MPEVVGADFLAFPPIHIGPSDSNRPGTALVSRFRACDQTLCRVIPTCAIIDTISTSWPGLSRPSTTLNRLANQDVDATGPRACPRSVVLKWCKSSKLDLHRQARA